MSWENTSGYIGTFFASSDYNDEADQYKIVTSTGVAVAGGLGFRIATSQTAFALGVLQDRPSSGTPGLIAAGPGIVTKVRCSTSHSAIDVGTKLCASTAGFAIPSTAVARYVLGRSLAALALNTAGLIPMLITHQGSGSTSAAGGS